MRRLAVAFLGLVTVTAAAWVLVSPLAAAVVPLLLATTTTVRRLRGRCDLGEYVAASDRARSAEPPWWPEFEHEFRRDCRRRERARRRHDQRREARHSRHGSG